MKMVQVNAFFMPRKAVDSVYNLGTGIIYTLNQGSDFLESYLSIGQMDLKFHLPPLKSTCPVGIYNIQGSGIVVVSLFHYLIIVLLFDLYVLIMKK